MQITADLAQEIIKRLVQYIEVPMNIMDLDGKIVASSDASRIDQTHSGAAKVIENKEEVILTEEEAKAYPGTKPGVNLPVIHMNALAGVVGVTGNPDEIIQVTRMTKASVEIALEQMYLQRKTFYTERQWSQWLQLLLHPSGFNEEELVEEASYTLNAEVNDTWKVFVLIGTDAQTLLDSFRREINKENIEPLFVLPFGDTEIVAALPGDVKKARVIIEGFLAGSELSAQVGVGQAGFGVNGLRQSYFQSKQALEFAGEMSSYSSIDSWKIERLTASIPESEYHSVCRDYAELLGSLEAEYVKTIDAYLQTDFKVKDTADQLHIHRNTLLYRLDQIKKRIGLDPRSFHDAFILKVIRSRQV